MNKLKIGDTVYVTQHDRRGCITYKQSKVKAIGRLWLNLEGQKNRFSVQTHTEDVKIGYRERIVTYEYMTATIAYEASYDETRLKYARRWCDHRFVQFEDEAIDEVILTCAHALGFKFDPTLVPIIKPVQT